MITAFVQFKLPQPVTREKARETFLGTAPRYRETPGLLRKYYHRFHANCEADPTGYATLTEVLGQSDMSRFQRHWETYVMKLRFP